jgi:hypothetical protein
MITAAAVYKVLTSLSAWVQLRDVCVFTGPFFAGNTVRQHQRCSEAGNEAAVIGEETAVSFAGSYSGFNVI